MNSPAAHTKERIAQVSSGERERERQLFYNILAGVVSVIPKLAAAVLSGSVTLYASVMKTINEALGIVVAWLIARKIARGDGTYDYGMGKFENIARIITGGILLISVLILVVIAVMKLLAPGVLGTSGIVVGMAITLIMIVIDTGFWFRNYRIARHEPSPLMDSQWRLFRLKAFANIVVFLALVLAILCSAYPWAIYIDPVASLVIIGILFRSGYGMIQQSLPDLLDRTLDEELQLVVIRELAGHFDRYEQVHAVKSRRSGGSTYIEIFLEFQGDMRMSEVQGIMDRMKQSLEEKIPKSTVNIIPTGCHS